MARLDSPFPPHHRNCPLGGIVLPPMQIAGLLDGDATIVVSRLGGSPSPRPRIVVATRDDDPTPFALWSSVLQLRGSPLGWLRRRAELRRNEWVLDDPRQIIELTDWLVSTPPLAPRSECLIDIARAASTIILSREAGTPAGDADLEALVAASREVSRSPQPLPASPQLTSATDEQIAWSLSGLIAADGSLALRNRKARYAPVMALSQRSDNRALLQAYVDRLGLGDLIVQGTQVSLRVTRLDDCQRLADIVRGHPLPASSPRSRQFDVWMSAVAMRGTRPGSSADMSAAFENLRRAKRYAGPRLLCSCR